MNNNPKDFPQGDSHEIMGQIYGMLASGASTSLVELVEQGMSKLNVSERQFSEAVGVQRKSLQRLLGGEAKKIDVLTVLKLGELLDINLKDIIQVYVSGLPVESVGELERAKKAGFILRNFDVDGLKKEGVINSTSDFDHIEEKIKHYFSLESIFQYNGLTAALFSRTRNSSSDKMTRFWIGSAYHICKQMNNPNPYNRQELFSLIPKLRGFTRDDKFGLLQVTRILFSVGVNVVVQSYMVKTQVRGATFLVNKKPCIVLADFNKRYDTLWFALMHELYHVLKDLDSIAAAGYHLSKEEGQLPIEHDQEMKANVFAAEFLLPSDKRSYIASFINIPPLVEKYALKWDIHPSIIYGLFLKEKGEKMDYQKIRPLLATTEISIANLMAHPWRENIPLEKSADKLKETLTSVTL
jgi:HTH-type transcriptional regulator/antitoxin HigA